VIALKTYFGFALERSLRPIRLPAVFSSEEQNPSGQKRLIYLLGQKERDILLRKPLSKNQSTLNDINKFFHFCGYPNRKHTRRYAWTTSEYWRTKFALRKGLGLRKMFERNLYICVCKEFIMGATEALRFLDVLRKEGLLSRQNVAHYVLYSLYAGPEIWEGTPDYGALEESFYRKVFARMLGNELETGLKSSSYIFLPTEPVAMTLLPISSGYCCRLLHIFWWIRFAEKDWLIQSWPTHRLGRFAIRFSR